MAVVIVQVEFTIRFSVGMGDRAMGRIVKSRGGGHFHAALCLAHRGRSIFEGAFGMLVVCL